MQLNYRSLSVDGDCVFGVDARQESTSDDSGDGKHLATMDSRNSRTVQLRKLVDLPELRAEVSAVCVRSFTVVKQGG